MKQKARGRTMLADLNDPRVNDVLVSVKAGDTNVYRVVAVEDRSVVLLHKEGEAWAATPVKRADLVTGFLPYRPEIKIDSFWDEGNGSGAARVLAAFATPDETSWVVYSYSDYPNTPLFMSEENFRKSYRLVT